MDYYGIIRELVADQRKLAEDGNAYLDTRVLDALDALLPPVDGRVRIEYEGEGVRWRDLVMTWREWLAFAFLNRYTWRKRRPTRFKA